MKLAHLQNDQLDFYLAVLNFLVNEDHIFPNIVLPVLIPFAITGYKCLVFLYGYSPSVRIERTTSR